MVHDTQSLNKKRQDLSRWDEIWIFGYGSLIYKVDFPYLKKSPAFIDNWQRRFWQGSHDHRGTPDNPGRVLTLVEEENTCCYGMAYQVTVEEFEHLDHREKNGYLRFEIDMHLANGETKLGLVYIAPQENEAYLGPASEKEIAAHIFKSRGPSGENRDYVFKLAAALRAANEIDEHVFQIEKHLIELASPFKYHS
ncbi:gamma-glutamylcyclotransferase [Aliikangiella marina]|uniref:glutathione-specific gamma-glutamylcyclotransferase n=1 Tax=Aliikangiella marina TaxID=1712262 RepID=A0A545THP1_9GAMM|nr:gamma-glutamylcyclotransferase [Aliikangiella marina]TQV76747.1 gamma-glutamylcyclotransferase [Aliikangiella marina]